MWTTGHTYFINTLMSSIFTGSHVAGQLSHSFFFIFPLFQFYGSIVPDTFTSSVMDYVMCVDILEGVFGNFVWINKYTPRAGS